MSKFSEYIDSLQPSEKVLACEAVVTYLKGYASEKKKVIRSSKDVYDRLRHTSLYSEEVVTVLFINQANEVISEKEVSKGGITSAFIDNRVILREALLHNAVGIILSHNHPSGDPRPSGQDLNATDSLRKACGVMDIKLLDHVIVAGIKYFSFADENCLSLS